MEVRVAKLDGEREMKEMESALNKYYSVDVVNLIRLVQVIYIITTPQHDDDMNVVSFRNCVHNTYSRINVD